MKDLYTENYKTMLKDIKDTNEWKNSHRSKSLKFWISVVPKVIYRFNTMPIKIPAACSAEIISPKIIWILKEL